ncbi:MAG: hypothetical protein IPK82_23045 [Polyangiaceae bacterium]|nr:hypothetical protein [Polyangiaceae bacterium]
MSDRRPAPRSGHRFRAAHLPQRAAALFIASAAIAVGVSGCIERGYPLGPSGNVELRFDVAGALFAADDLDAEGKGKEPRQAPFKTGVTLLLVEGSEAANGGFVDVHIEPSEALLIESDSDEQEDAVTCKEKDGKFRCTATPEGVARFNVTALGTWSGEATVVVTWADQRKESVLNVLPAGLPSTVTNFEMIASGLSDTGRVLPTYTALACTNIDALPDDLGSKWRPGNIRAREAFVRAAPPVDDPDVVANAPVIIESRSSEGALSLSQDCADADRVTRLRVLLDATGQSPPFYVCFSDLGGDVGLSITSGALSVSPEPAFDVVPEPRVLRVSALTDVVTQDDVAPLFEISAFNTDLKRIPLDVDLESSNPSVLKLSKASETLSGEGTDPTSLVVTPGEPGEAVLHVRPQLYKNPDCQSIPVTVVPVP